MLINLTANKPLKNGQLTAALQWSVMVLKMEKEEYVLIHGYKWKKTDIQEPVDWAITQTWRKILWSSIPHKDTHDHCQVCWWTLFDSEEAESGVGYVNENNCWLCTECYEQFINQNHNKVVQSPSAGTRKKRAPLTTALRLQTNSREQINEKNDLLRCSVRDDLTCRKGQRVPRKSSIFQFRELFLQSRQGSKMP